MNTSRPLISVQHMVMTPAIRDIIAEDETIRNLELVSAVRQMLAGSWGEVDEEDSAANDSALRDGSRMLGAYRIGGESIWIIVEAGEPMTETEPAKRSALTVLRPEDY